MSICWFVYGWSVGWSVSWSVCHNFLKGREVTIEALISLWVRNIGIMVSHLQFFGLALFEKCNHTSALSLSDSNVNIHLNAPWIHCFKAKPLLCNNAANIQGKALTFFFWQYDNVHPSLLSLAKILLWNWNFEVNLNPLLQSPSSYVCIILIH